MGSSTLEEIKNNIRATLTGNKKGITEEELSKQYRENCYQKIPFQNFGYAKLSDFLNSIDDVIRIIEVNNERYYSEIPKKETQHITTFVQLQNKGTSLIRGPSKKEKKVQKTNARRLPSEEIMAIKKILLHFPSGIDIDTFNKQYMNDSGQNFNYEKYGFSNQVESFKSLSWLLSVRAKNGTQYIDLKEKDLRSKVVDNSIPQHVIINLEQLIMDQPHGMHIDNLMEHYKNKYKERLAFDNYGYDSLPGMIRSLSLTLKMESCDSSWNIRYIGPINNSDTLDEVNKNLKKIYDEDRLIGILTSDIFDYYLTRYNKKLDLSSLGGFQNMESMLNALCDFEEPYFFMEKIAGPKYILKVLSKASPPKKNLFDIEELKFIEDINSCVDVIVDEIENPWDFYVRLRKYDNALMNLMKNLDKYCKQKISSLILDIEELHLGDYIASYYTGSRQWHRAVVVEIEHHNSISICYIDYGTLEKNVKIDRIVRLDPLFYDLPKQAIRVKSANIWPLNSSKNSIIEAGEYMYGLVVQKELIGKLISFSSERVPEILLIDISLNKSTEVLFVNEFLLKRGVVSDKPPKNDGKQKKGLRRPLRTTQDLIAAKPTIKKLLLGDRYLHLIPGTEFQLRGELQDILVASPEISNLFPKWKGKDILVKFLVEKQIKFPQHQLNEPDLQIYRSLIRNDNITSFKKYPSDARVIPVTMFLLKDVPRMITIFGEPDSGYITKIIKNALDDKCYS
ncbi:uncharacterized protein [Lepeophtheirus salmonis]|uniref:uncharacterized protein n=1 Tax=Lepeophtheirus salmonis TaxID=72036 RepID=UPI001AE2D16D|nr:uncharacterized protein LOC121119167 [Lepeophtheirus salmonis]